MMNFTKGPVVIALLTFGFCTSSMAVNADGPEWSYSNMNKGFTMTVKASACFQSASKSRMSLHWFRTIDGSNVSADATCECGEGIKINDDVTFTSTSFADLVKAGIATDLKTYSCVPMN